MLGNPAAQLEGRKGSVHRRVHVVFVPGCIVDDEAHNQAVERKALEANPPPEGAQLQIIRFVSAKRTEAMG